MWVPQAEEPRKARVLLCVFFLDICNGPVWSSSGMVRLSRATGSST